MTHDPDGSTKADSNARGDRGATGTPGAVGALTDHLFRHESANLRAVLVRILGPHRLDLADDIVQESLLAALKHWRFSGVPDNPAAWLNSVARRKAIDVIRRDRRHAAAEPALVEWARQRQESEAAGAGPQDETLRLMFMCCHPSVAEPDRVLLTLALVAGFGSMELARAFLVSPGATEQRLSRAKRSLRDAEARLSLEEGCFPVERAGAVLDTMYLMLNEAYAAHAGDQLIRRDLFEETMRLLRMLLESPASPPSVLPAAHALASLSSFLAARLATRTDDRGALVLMQDQDRSRWDRERIAIGFWHLARSSAGASLTPYQVEAAIAACHAAAPSFDQTDWGQIIALYTLLEQMKPTQVVKLNKAVALAMRDGPDAGLAALASFDSAELSGRYHLVESTRGEILMRAGRSSEAARAFRRALELPTNEPERALLQAKLRAAEFASTHAATA